eukprot:6202846-Pleurochrysis_carterae.AAC.1
MLARGGLIRPALQVFKAEHQLLQELHACKSYVVHRCAQAGRAANEGVRRRVEPPDAHKPA